MLLNRKLGPATNSSSTHCIIFNSFEEDNLTWDSITLAAAAKNLLLGLKQQSESVDSGSPDVPYDFVEDYAGKNKRYIDRYSFIKLLREFLRDAGVSYPWIAIEEVME